MQHDGPAPRRGALRNTRINTADAHANAYAYALATASASASASADALNRFMERP